MKWSGLMLLLLLGAGVCPVPAQGTNELEQLRGQLLRMQEDFERVQREQREQIEQLRRKLELLERGSQGVVAEATVSESAVPAPSPDTNAPAVAWSPASPIQLKSGRAYMDIGLSGTFAAGSSTADDITDLQLGGHDPNQRGFTVQG
ncbi:MAG TPA: hypothetical protein VN673_02985, partial [Clostridia bacterium]|nr:hypothetical protein [Clostridia bacterium]